MTARHDVQYFPSSLSFFSPATSRVWHSSDQRHLLLVDYDFPPELHDHLDWAPPTRMKVGKDLYKPHREDLKAGRACFACRFHGVQSTASGGSSRRWVAEKVVKLIQNAIFGRCCMNPDKEGFLAFVER